METVIRVALIYSLILIALRILGKRELSEMSSFEFVTLMLIPEIVQQSLVREDFSITNAVVGLATLLSMVFLISLLTFRFKRVADVFDGQPTVLFQSGRFFEETMNKERITPEDLLEEIHSAGYEGFDQIKWVILQPDGEITCIPYRLGRPVIK